jgi:molybdopterin/thiamine biosynthesis adenylyltransferase
MTIAAEEVNDPAEALRIGQAVARDILLDVLAQAGFRRAAAYQDRWRGVLTFRPAGGFEAARTTVVDIVIADDFPFTPPKVHPLSRGWAEQVTGKTFGDSYHEAGNGWHRDGDRAMCLFIEADHTRLPWADGRQLLEQIRAWLAQDAAEWNDDTPALDLDRYLHPATERALILYGDLTGHEKKIFQLRRDQHDVLRVGPVAAPRRRGRSGGHQRWPTDTVLILNANELANPIRSWNDLHAAIDVESAHMLTRAYGDGLRKVLIIYRHRDAQGVLGLALAAGKNDEITVKSLTTAPDDLTTRDIRSHPRAEDLDAMRVAVVGVGAIGSVIADLLHRSRIGELLLIDGDLVLPGNTTRHLLDSTAVGLPKARAVADALHKTRPRFGSVKWRNERLRSMADIFALFGDHDLVVDATADSTTTAMLTAAARSGAGQLLSVCVLADGYAVRVDRTPTREDDLPLPTPQLPPSDIAVYETGCGSPVSRTPPAAVWEAAAIAARHTIGLLLAPGSVPPGEQRVLNEAPDQ